MSSVLVQQEHIQMLKEIMEDDFAHLIEVYLRDGASNLKAIEKGLQEGDCETVFQAAHSLKGSSSNLGVDAIAGSCLDIEMKGRAGELDGLQEKLQEMKDLFPQVEAELLSYTA